MLSTIDVMPTVLDLVGAPRSETEYGRSGCKQLRGEVDPNWENIIFTHPFGNERVACFTPEWELGFDFHGEPIFHDRLNDQNQSKNLYKDPNYSEIIAQIRQRMDDHYAVNCPRVAQWLPGNMVLIPRFPTETAVST